MTRPGLRKLSVSHTQCSPFTNGNAPLTPGFVVLCAPLLCQCGLVRKTEPHHGRGSVTEVMKEGGKVRKGRTVVHETTQSLAKAGSCSHPQGWRDSGRRHLHQRVHPPERSPGARLSEWRPQSSCPDYRLTLSSMPVTLWCPLRPVHLLLTQHLPSPPSTQWFVPRYMKPRPCTFCPWKLTHSACLALMVYPALI